MNNMHNLIIKHKTEEHFYINRATGSIIDEAFTYKVMTGKDGGKAYVQSIASFQDTFEIVGSNKTDKGVH